MLVATALKRLRTFLNRSCATDRPAGRASGKSTSPTAPCVRGAHRHRQYPLEGRFAFGLAEGDELVAKDLEARLLHEPRVRRWREAREERWCAKPVPGLGLSVARSKRGHQQTAGDKPAADPR